jgi:hypothetical protein
MLKAYKRYRFHQGPGTLQDIIQFLHYCFVSLKYFHADKQRITKQIYAKYLITRAPIIPFRVSNSIIACHCIFLFTRNKSNLAVLFK